MNKWIDISLCSPKLNQQVLCYNDCEAENFRFLVLTFDGIDKFYTSEPPTSTGIKYNVGYYTGSITHWMPLPLPPKT